MHRMRLALVLLLAAALGGCLDVESEARIEAGGGGTFVETVTVDLARLALAREQFEEMAKGMGADPAALNPFARFDPKRWLVELEAVDGISDVKSESAPAPKGMRRHVVRGRFTSLEALIETGPVDDVTGALWRQDDGKAWQFMTRSLYDDDRWDVSSRKTLLGLRKKLLEPFRKALESLDIRRTIVFPSKVLDTNGEVAPDGRTVTWRLSFDDLADPANLRQRVVFEHTPTLRLVRFGDKPAAAPGKAADKGEAKK